MANILERRLQLRISEPQLTNTQLKIDGIIKAVPEHISDVSSFTAILTGGLAYRFGKMAILGNSWAQKAPYLFRTLAPVGGLTMEVAAYRGVHHSLKPELASNPWLADFINFGTLKSFGKLASNTNPIFMNFIQDTGMVVGHHVAAFTGLAPVPQGSLLDQYVDAEVLNAQMKVGLAAIHHASGGKILAYERSLDLFLSITPVNPSKNFSDLHSKLNFDKILLFSKEMGELPPLDRAIYDLVNSYQRPREVTEINQPHSEAQRIREDVEIARLHAEIMKTGLQLLVDPSTPTLQAIQHLSSGQALLKLGNRAVFESENWGSIDLRALAEPHAWRYYPGNIRQAELARDLAILFNRSSITLPRNQSEWGENGREIFRDNHWNILQGRWQKHLWFVPRIEWMLYQGEEGYDRFSEEHFGGQSQKAWMFARTFFPSRAEMKRTLLWEHQKVTRVNLQSELRAELTAGIEDGTLKGETGYDLFTLKHFGGNSQRAHQAASSLLKPDQIRKLEWEIKSTYVQDQEAIRQKLREGLVDGSLKGEAGYLMCADLKWFGGYTEKAWNAARTLLSPSEFKELEWPERPIPSHISQHAIYREFLLEGLTNGNSLGPKGYDRFAQEFFTGNSQSAWFIARGLLNPNDFEALQWGKRKLTNIIEQEEIRSQLREGLADGSFFGERGLAEFAESFGGNKKRAWDIASSLLSDIEFLLLGWEFPSTASKETGKSRSLIHSMRFESSLAISAPIPEQAMGRFLLLLLEKPRTLGRRFLKVLQNSHQNDSSVQALAQWMQEIIGDFPHLSKPKPKDTEKAHKPEPKDPTDKAAPNSSPKKPEGERTPPPLDPEELGQIVKEIHSNPGEKIGELLARLDVEMGYVPAVKLLILWVRAYLNKQGIQASEPNSATKTPHETEKIATIRPLPSPEGIDAIYKKMLKKPEEISKEDIEDIIRVRMVKREEAGDLRKIVRDWEMAYTLIFAAFNPRTSAEAKETARAYLDQITTLFDNWVVHLEREHLRPQNDLLSRVNPVEDPIIARSAKQELRNGNFNTNPFGIINALQKLTFTGARIKSSSELAEAIILAHPRPWFRLTLLWSTREGLLKHWYGVEQFLLFQDLFSGDPLRVKMAKALVKAYSDIRRKILQDATGIPHMAANPFQEIMEALQNPEKLANLYPEMGLGLQEAKYFIREILAPALTELDPATSTKKLAMIEAAVGKKLKSIARKERPVYDPSEQKWKMSSQSITAQEIAKIVSEQTALWLARKQIPISEIPRWNERMNQVMREFDHRLRSLAFTPEGYVNFQNLPVP